MLPIHLALLVVVQMGPKFFLDAYLEQSSYFVEVVCLAKLPLPRSVV